MKDIQPRDQALFQVNPTEALERIQSALDFLWKDATISMHDKVAGDYDFEELMAALLSAEAALQDG